MEELAFLDVYETHRTRIRNYILHMTSAAEVDDLLQEFFVRVHTGLGDFRGKSKITTWLYRIATNVVIDSKRAEHTQKNPVSIPLDIIEETGMKQESSQANQGNIDESILSQERIECYARFIRNLPQTYVAIMVLSELEGLKPEEIAPILGISTSASKVRLHRGRKILLEELRKNCKAEEWLM